MGSTNFTPHYDIPLPLGSDKTTPMDYNTSMQAVDTALFEAQGNASDAKQSVTTLTQDLAQTNENVSALAGRVTTAEGTITSQGTAITNLGTRVDGVEADAQDMICAYNEATATASRNYAIGDYFIYNDVLYRATQAINRGATIVPDTNCTTTNVTSEIKNFSPDLSAYQTKQDNALTTTSKQVVGAINEIKSDLSMTTITPTPVSNSYGTSALKYRRFGSLLIVFGTFTIATTFGGWVNLEDLPIDIVDDGGTAGIMAVTSAQATDKTTLLYRINDRHVYVQGNSTGTFYVNAVFEIE